ncbi:glycerate kinase [Candidatus Sororendozoicomonas aggregata]|uniref:glycerate kinase n=1 Tax=Candidatus Sororendozoicomonas aggregata TaxID=3073239 RepID=UPI002ED0DBF0
MKIIIAPDSFKESLTALNVANAIETGFRKVLPEAEYIKIPMADGGEGTMRTLVDATGGKVIDQAVTGPLGNCCIASFGLLGDGETAVIEMAKASGIELIGPEERNPLYTTTLGTGQLIRGALAMGVKRIIVGIGGSATNDGGAGMMQALGVRFLNAAGTELPVGGGALEDLADIDTRLIDPRLSQVEFIAACDVDNPLTGSNGASVVFGPQKGADSAMIKQLDAALDNYATVLKRVMGQDVSQVPGAGAAGGMGAALLAFMKASIKPGIDIVMDVVDMKAQCEGADLVITGEGRIDGQTANGKTPVGVAKEAKKAGLPVIAICGSVGEGVEAVYEQGIDALFPIVHSAVSLKEAFSSCRKNLEREARNLATVCKMQILTG